MDTIDEWRIMEAQVMERWRVCYMDTEVSWYDVGSGLYIVWIPEDGDSIRIVSQDGERVLGTFAPQSHIETLADAEAEIKSAVEDPDKAYGVEAGLWS